MEYIEREAFIAEQRHLYCENCARRKNGKGKFVYEIGDAPCRACDIGDVLDAVEDAPAADAIEELQKRVPKTPHGRLIDIDAPYQIQVHVDWLTKKGSVDIYAPAVLDADPPEEDET